ncbi:hypothetical protein [Vibrio sp. AND4]|uniref:hypothetical protein n=1 Tax=Vibrio sp. AND4 TaxID=314289 RepID=UPI00015F03EA|nr:hypothetical protein [Vibrio sp. AND4]EDP57794.1 HvnA; halovibrin [Vibrio sp. AND4]
MKLSMLMVGIGLTLSHTASAAENQTGLETAAYLNKAYNDTRKDCGSKTAPAFLCSGVTFRGGEASPAFKVWNPSPASQESGGVSFSYIRKDAKYEKLAYGYTSGFILYPIYFSPKEKIDLDYLCSFPIDAATNNRGDKGCGAHRANPDVSKKCSEQNITTAEQWRTHWSKNGNWGQCGFDISEASKEVDTSARFYQSLRATQLIDNSRVTQNEIRIATWYQNIGNVLPIQAFFYLSGSTPGKLDAQYYQEDFYQTEGIWVPIIEFDLPDNPREQADFTFRAEDQAIAEH